MARTSARSVSRDLPSSPPTKPASPIRRTTRTTRSQSVDLDAHRPRQESIESTGDKNEQQDSRGGRRAARKQALVRRELSMVAEDREVSSEEEDAEQAKVDEDPEAGEQADDEEDPEAGEQADEEEDPEATKVADQEEEDLDTTKVASGQEYDSEDEDHSEFSDDTRTTSHTKRVMQIIHSRSAIETLPDLYNTAQSIISKSTKKDIRPKEMGRHLKALESLSNGLEVYKEPYGREEFIEVDIVLEKVSGALNAASLGSSDLGDWTTPFAAILQSANLATLLGQVIQLREDNEVSQQDLMLFLQSLEKMFPRPFVSKFAAPTDLGSESSRLINETHAIMLEIRTQLFELTARQLEPGLNFNATELLNSCFEGGLKKKDIKTSERVDIIHSMFLPPDQAKDSGRYVDFERLNKSFPRSKFFNDLVDYGEKRWLEVGMIVDNRGGIDNVMVPFEEVVKDIPSDAEEETVKSGQPDSEPEIRADYEPEVLEHDDSTISERDRQASAPKKRKDFHDNPSAITKLVGLRKMAGSRKSGDIEVSSSFPASSQPQQQKQDSQITQYFKKYSDSQNKENKSPEQPQRSRGRPLITATTKRSGMYRKHSNAQKVGWEEDSQGFPIDSQADDPEPPHPRNNKRKFPPPNLQVEDELPQVSQPKTNKRKAGDANILSDDKDNNSDNDFETDERKTIPGRRIAAPKSSARPSKRARTEEGESSRVQDSPRRKNSGETSASPEVQSDDDNHSEDQGFEADKNLPKPKTQRSKEAHTEAGESSRAQIPPRKNRSPSPILAPENDDDEQNQEDLEQEIQHREELSRPPQVPDDNEGSVQLPLEDPPSTVAHSFTQASALENVRAKAIKNGFSVSQTRTPWSDEDTQLLIDYIGDLGPWWSEIEKRGEFERDNITQVGLKDKARNIKVDMLLAGQTLPRNFTGVKLNANLIKRVKRTWPDYDPYTDTGYGTF
ncbi:uncharacterized protein EAF02_011719 [Botrytis sinoallii]|uniref:uncharacterized protein n=1 Tax=Botrytis sinoallii TaxID=1463999 RepID=UPI0019016B60|nr:uncharacterized protein EAF02_011719 [Botrytis sinoallii]KAF7854101.1 hypothetical protein EAF02_011719 [Botrytis sinoallii]